MADTFDTSIFSSDEIKKINNEVIALINKLETSSKSISYELFEQIEHQVMLNKLRNKSVESVKKQLEIELQKLKVQREIINGHKELIIDQEEIDKLEDQINKKEQRRQQLKDTEELYENKMRALNIDNESRLDRTLKKKKEAVRHAKDEYQELFKKAKLQGKSVDEIEKDADITAAGQRLNKAANEAELSALIKGFSNKLLKLGEDLLTKIDKNVDMYSDYMGRIDARLQGIDDNTSKTFDSINNKIASSLGNSTFVNFQNILKSVDELSKSGISYNIEERAFLSVAAEKMVANFDVLNSNLTRMIRLQQADMTRLALGNEATLTRLFNTMFEDSSFLAKGVDESVAGAIFDAAGLMNVSDSSAFQFAVQKWLGSLYEVGVSDSTVSSIAQAINLLGSGQAEAFTNSPVATLLNLATARSGYSLSDVLTQGVNIDFIDNLMTSMIELLTDIKNNTSNQVTLSAYANVMGLSVSDIRGFSNLTADDISDLIRQKQNVSEVDEQLKMFRERTTLKEQIDNYLSNMVYIMGEGLTKDTGKYLMWKGGQLLRSVAGSVGGSISTLLGGSGLAMQLGAAAKGYYDMMSIRDDEDKNTIASSNLTSLWNNLTNTIKSLYTGWSPESLLGLKGDTYVRYNRGENYISRIPTYGRITNNTSYSSGVYSTENLYNPVNTYGESTNTTYNRIANLANTAQEYSANYVEYSSANKILETVTLQDLYKELFVNQDFPIKVHISHFDDKAISQLKSDVHMEDDYQYLSSLYRQSQAQGIPVQLDQSDASLFINQVYNVRGAF